MRTIIGIVGSYREDHACDRLVSDVLAGATEAGAATRRVWLPAVDIKFCTNCRACMQEPGDAPGRCPLDDEMAELLAACLRADGLVLAAPHNMGAATAVFKRFLERLAPLAYWPFGVPAPRKRGGVPAKQAVLVTTAAAPTVIWRLGGFTAERTLRYTAKQFNAKVTGVLKYGLMSREPRPTLTDAQRAAARASGRRLG